MATLAYPVSQSTTNKLFGPTIGTSFGNAKPTGKSFNSITNVNWKWVLEANKLNGNSVTPSTFIKLKVVLDNKKLSLMPFNPNWVQADTPNIGFSNWVTDNIKGFFKSSSDAQTATTKTSHWIPNDINFGTSIVTSMTTGNVYAGSLVEPYLYETFTTGSMILVRNTTIGISTNSTETIHSYNEKMLTLETGCVLAYGELERNNGWVN